MTEQEKLGDIIYRTLKEDKIIKENRAYITDILSEAIIKAGYVELPEQPKCQECKSVIKLEQDKFGLIIVCNCASAYAGYNPDRRWSKQAGETKTMILLIWLIMLLDIFWILFHRSNFLINQGLRDGK